MLNERAQKVLRAVVRSYIARPEPVGSRYLTKAYKFNLSSATIRNIMADLEDMGYLMQPHTSAGRRPTDMGFRFYVDNLKFKERDAGAERLMGHMKKKYTHLRNDLNSLLGGVTQHMANATGCAVFAVPLRPDNTTLNRVQLFRYKGNRTVVLLLTNEGLITNRVIDSDFGLTQKDLDRVSDFLNSEYSGYTISEVRKSIKDRVAQEKALRDILITQCMQITREAFAYDANEIIISGISELMSQPEFSSKIDSIMRAIDDKHKMIDILDSLGASGGIDVIIGKENSESRFSDLSIVSAQYSQGDRVLGRVGVIGSTRMDYNKTMPMVDVMARYVSSMIIS